MDRGVNSSADIKCLGSMKGGDVAGGDLFHISELAATGTQVQYLGAVLGYVAIPPGFDPMRMALVTFLSGILHLAPLFLQTIMDILRELSQTGIKHEES